MGLFHKHTYKLLSVDEMVKNAVFINRVEVHSEHKFTTVVEQCTSCYKIRERDFTGHHAADIKKNYKKAKKVKK